jgi:hypothetical protein
MINNPDLQIPKVKPYHHQISLECIEKTAAYIEDNDIEKIDCDTYVSQVSNIDSSD